MKIFQISFSLLTTVFLLCQVTFCSSTAQAHSIPGSVLEMKDSCPTVSFSIANNNVTVGTSVNFVNESTGGTSYFWDFGDGSISTAENPSHAYAATGTYTVKLIVIGGTCTVEFIGTEDVIIS